MIVRFGRRKKRICPVCGQYKFKEKYDICPICSWENDPVQLADETFAGGANEMSLAEAREAWNSREKEEQGISAEYENNTDDKKDETEV